MAIVRWVVGSSLFLGCASSGPTAPEDAPDDNPARLLIDLGIQKPDFDAFDPHLMQAAPAGGGLFGTYPTTEPTKCRIAAVLGAMKLIELGQEGATVITCTDDLWATSVVTADEVELSHGPPGTKNDLRTARR